MREENAMKFKKMLSAAMALAVTVTAFAGFGVTADAAIGTGTAEDPYYNYSFNDWATETIVNSGYGDSTITATSTDGELSFAVGNNEKNAGNISILEDADNKYMQIVAGQFSTDGRRPTMTFNNMPTFESMGDEQALVVEFDFANRSNNPILYFADSDTTKPFATVDIVNALGIPGSESPTWYHAKMVIAYGEGLYTFTATAGDDVKSVSGIITNGPTKFGKLGVQGGKDAAFFFMDNLKIYTETAPEVYNLIVKSNPYAQVTANGSAYYTNEDGVAAIPCIAGSVASYKVEKSGYTASETKTVTMDANNKEVELYVEPSGENVLFYEDYTTTGLADKATTLFGAQRFVSGKLMVWNNDSISLTGVDGAEGYNIKIAGFNSYASGNNRDRINTVTFKDGDKVAFVLKSVRSGADVTSAIETATENIAIENSGNIDLTIKNGRLTGTAGETVIDLAAENITKIDSIAFAATKAEVYLSMTIGAIEISGIYPEVSAVEVNTADKLTAENIAALKLVKGDEDGNKPTTDDVVTTYTIKVDNYTDGVPSLVIGDETLTPSGNVDYAVVSSEDGSASFVIQTIGFDKATQVTFGDSVYEVPAE